MTHDEDDASASVKVRNFILQKAIIPFVKDLREGNPSHLEVLNNDATCDRTQSFLLLDSDILLKYEEVSEQMSKNRINFGKEGGKFTKFGSSWDRSSLFANVKFNQKREIAEEVDTPLRKRTTKASKSLANKSC